MSRIRVILIALLTAVMAIAMVIPANAAGGGRYTWNYANSDARVQVSGPGPSGPQVTKNLRPDERAAGISKVLFFKAPAGFTVNRWCFDGTKPHGYSVARFSGNVWHKACPDNQEMHLRVDL